MNRSRYFFSFALVIILLATVIPLPSYARGEKGLNVSPTYLAGSIGTIEAFGTLFINGQMVHQKMTVNTGDYLQTADSTTATISLPNAGQVVLGQNTLAYLRMGRVRQSDGVEQPIFIASLLRGSLSTKFNSSVGAYVESAGQVFTTNPGSDFRAYNYDGRLKVVGDVQFQNRPQYIVRPVEVGATLSVKARSTRQIQIQVTDEKDRPVPDIPIIFTLGSQLGKLGADSTFTATTNSQGIASTTFTAGNAPGTTSITATVKDTNYSWTGEISVYKAVGFWSTRNKILISAAAVAVGVTTGVVVSSGEGKRGSVIAQPPDIRPK